MKLIYPSFTNDERIVRVVYSTYHINPKDLKFKPNFLKFKFNPNTNKKELSCVRFEFDTIESCRSFGQVYADANFKRVYFGLGCTNPYLVNQLEGYQFQFTPNLTSSPKNYFHCDIYDTYDYTVIDGEAPSAEINYRFEQLREKWVAYPDTDNQLTSQDIIAE